MTSFEIAIIVIAGVFLLLLSTCFIILLTFYTKYIKKSKVNKSEQYKEFNQGIKKCNIAFLGDSLTEFYRTDEFLHDYDIHNRGIAADTTDDILKRIESNVISINPKKVFLQIGTNDLGDKKSIEYTVNNIKKILSILKEKLTKTKLYFISLYPVNSKFIAASRLIVGFRKNSDLKEINSIIKEYCENENITFINVFDHLTDEDGNLKKEYTVEGLHISFTGYSVITPILKQYLDAEKNA